MNTPLLLSVVWSPQSLFGTSVSLLAMKIIRDLGALSLATEKQRLRSLRACGFRVYAIERE
jgi:hypothetical protein